MGTRQPTPRSLSSEMSFMRSESTGHCPHCPPDNCNGSLEAVYALQHSVTAQRYSKRYNQQFCSSRALRNHASCAAQPEKTKPNRKRHQRMQVACRHYAALFFCRKSPLSQLTICRRFAKCGFVRWRYASTCYSTLITRFCGSRFCLRFYPWAHIRLS